MSPFAHSSCRLELCAAVLAACALACGTLRESSLARVAAQQQEGHFEDTIPTLRGILDSDPGCARAHLLLGAALLKSGHSSRSIPSLGRAAEDSETGLAAGLLLGAALLETRNFEEAIRTLDRVLAREPDQPRTLRLRARAALELSLPESALRDADRLLRIGKNKPEDAFLRARALTALERFDDAKDQYLEIETGGQPSAERSAAACKALARLFEEDMQDRKSAQAQFENCLRSHPADPATIKLASEFFERSDKPERARAVWSDGIRQRPRDPRFHLGLASLLERQGQRDRAEEVLIEATQTIDSAPIWGTLAELRRRAGRHRDALEAVEHAVARSEPDAQRIRFLEADLLVDLNELARARNRAEHFEETAYRDLILARVHLIEGRPRDSLEAAGRGIERWPNNPAARYLAGRAAELLGDPDRALSEYREAVRADEGATDAALAMARLNLALGRFGAAANFAARHIRSRPFAGPEAHRVAARAAAASGHKKAADAILAELASLPGQQLAALVEKAALARRSAGPEAAARIIEQSALDLKRADNEPALRALVVDRVAAGRTQDALALVRQALGDRPNGAALHDLLGRVLLAEHKTSEAEAVFERALELSPGYAPALAGKAGVALQRGQLDAARVLFERASTADPADVQSATRAAQLSVSAGRTQEGIERLTEIVQHHPGAVDACNDLAWLLAESGQDLDRALDLAQRANRLEPDASTLDTLGWVHLKRGEAKAAVAALERAAADPKASASHHYHLGLARAAAGDRTGAAEQFHRALTTGPFPASEDARARLKALGNNGEASL